MRGLIGGDCHARRYRLSTGARAGRLPVSDLDYVVCTDSVPVQQERHDLRFPGLGQRKEVPCLCGELRRFTKSEATITTILTANLPCGSSALDVFRLPGPPQADSGRQRASRARTNDRKTSLPFIASGFTLRFSLLCSAMSGGSEVVLGIPATSTVCAGLLFGFWSFFGIRGVVEC